MAEKPKSPAMDFIVQQLQKDPEVAYRDIAAGAEKKGLEVFPIMYGRAKAMLGLVPTAPRGQGKKKRAAKAAKRAGRAAAAKPANGRRGGRAARDRAADGPGNALDEIIGTMREEQRERERYRKALEQIRAVLENL